MEATNQDRFLGCYKEWMSQQKTDLKELLSAGDRDGEEHHRALVAKSLRNYNEYYVKRRALSRYDTPAFFCPAWCSSLESSLLWMGGCRPSMFIRLVYTLSGLKVEAHVAELLTGVTATAGGGMAGLSARQLGLVNDVHGRIVRAEDGISSRMATLQEDVADKHLLSIARDRNMGGGWECSSVAGGGEAAAAAAMERYGESLWGIMEKADELRVGTVRELLVEILTPLQAVELLIAAKQLHLSVHEWGRVWDHQHARV